jgi:hypothetical protein
MRADSEILADLVRALSGTSRNGAHGQRSRHELTNRGHTEATGDLMTGPEHYIAAEELLAGSSQPVPSSAAQVPNPGRAIR